MADPKQGAKQAKDLQKEIELQVGELEERVDRLRAIYEQYFMGYEKLEPTVPRKDVDRRFVILRKMNIRNTALRFRFNVVTQKFNTYAMYWTRICRQIEEGTFKRHVQLAKRRFGGTQKREEEMSIDVELGDFEVDIDDFDMDAAAADISDDEQDTPPSMRAPVPAAASSPVPMMSMTKKAATLSFESMDDALDGLERKSLAPQRDTAPPSSSASVGQQRVARSAALPAGAKPRVLLKKGPPKQGEVEPHSTPTPGPQQAPMRRQMPSVPDDQVPAIRRAMPSVPDGDHAPPMRKPMPSVPEHVPPAPMRKPMPSVPEHVPPAPMRKPMPSVPEHVPPAQMRRPMPSQPDGGPPSKSVIRAATPHGPQGHIHRSPAGLVRPQISPSAQSVNKIPAAQPAGPPPSAPSMRVPAGPPASTPSIRVPPSQNRMPIGLPSKSIAPPAPPTPVPAKPEPVAARPAPAPSERRLPIPPATRGPMPAAAPVRPPAPSVPDTGNPVAARRPPPALPSQIKKS